jgi:MFS family permease
VVSGAQRRRAFIASLSGTSLEWYDFALYNIAAALLFGPLFFPDSAPGMDVVKAFGTYAVGYLARPVGGIVFGRLGDTLGRKSVLVSTLLLVGGATFCIGLLPTHAQAGAVAPVLLVILRFAQGVGVGGEWGGAVLLSSEFGDARSRGFWSSAAQVGPPIGTLLANGVVAVLAGTMAEADFLAWGWRVAFLLSALLVGFGLWLRVRMEETPVFADLSARAATVAAPITMVWRTRKRALASAIMARIGPDVLYALCTVFLLSYATQRLGLSRGQATVSVLAGSALQVVAIPAAGWLSDRWGRTRVYAVGAVGGGLWALAMFWIARDAGGLMLGVGVGLLFHAMMYGPQAAFITEQFEPALCYTGSSLAYTLAGPVGAAVAPALFALLAQWGSPLRWKSVV